jgi:ankyrin repeat protein
MLKDKLKSEVDSTGASALAHMCSHNSPYIPLYLSTLNYGDPILNRATSLGHTPLDIAGMYCKREYVDLLKEKGAVDDGKVDHWAIQGANISNWSGNVDVKKKELIAWAAFNNLP